MKISGKFLIFVRFVHSSRVDDLAAGYFYYLRQVLQLTYFPCLLCLFAATFAVTDDDGVSISFYV